MTNRHRVEISSVGDSGAVASLKVDGHDISGITTDLRLEVSGRAEHKLEVCLAAFPLSTELNSVHVRIDQDTHNFLVRLGWTPPEEATNAIH